MTRRPAPASPAGTGADTPEQVLEHVVRAIGLCDVARALPGRPGSPQGLDHHALSERLQAWPIRRWPLGDLVEISRLERRLFGEDDIAGIVRHLISVDHDDDPPAPQPQETAGAMVAAMGGALQAIAEMPQVVRHGADLEHYQALRAAVLLLTRTGKRLLNDYEAALGIRQPAWRRFAACACALLLVGLAFFANETIARRPRRRARNDMGVLITDDDDERKRWWGIPAL